MKGISTYIILFILSTTYSYTQIDNSVLKGSVLIEQGKYDEAIICLSDYLTKNPKAENGFLYRGISFMEKGNFPEAENDFKTALQLNNKLAYLQLAILYAKQNKAKQAILSIQKHLNKNPEINTIQFLKSNEFSSIHNSDEWFEFISDYTHSYKWTVIEEVLYHAGQKDFSASHQLIDNAIEKNPEVAIFYQTKSKVYEQSGNYTLAIYELNKAKALNQEDFVILTELGNLYSKEKKSLEAIACHESVKKLNPTDIHNRFSLALAYQDGGYYNKALNEISEYLEFFPDDIMAVLKQAELYYSLQNYNKTLAILNKHSNTESTNPNWLLLRGKAYYESKTYQSAAYDLSMYLDLIPTSAEGNYYLGLTQSKLGNQRLTCYYMKRAFNAGERKAFNFIQNNCE